MTGPMHDDTAESVRARRFEVVDDDGQVRAVFGLLPSLPPVSSVAGVEVRDASGRLTATVAVGDAESWVLLALGGNALVHVGVNDYRSDAVDARAFLFVCDDDGTPVAGWRVMDDGSVEWAGL